MKVKIKTTWLEICKKEQFIPREGFRDRIRISEVSGDIYLNFSFFTGVGLPWSWYSRLDWTKDQWDSYFQSCRVKTFLGFEGSTLIGYFELGFEEEGVAEIKLFGLFPQYMGRGLGGMFLSHAVDAAFANNVNRVWLHTCSKDSVTAIDNYTARGFTVYKEEEKLEEVPDREVILKSINSFYRNYITRFEYLSRL